MPSMLPSHTAASVQSCCCYAAALPTGASPRISGAHGQVRAIVCLDMRTNPGEHEEANSNETRARKDKRNRRQVRYYQVRHANLESRSHLRCG